LIVFNLFEVMHPSYKTTYFETAGWPAEWVTAAKQTLINHWKAYYKPELPSEVS
ncbi:hypothetical protein K435DRAFT_638817, partial [Dendrothele bispora CBS 962.96]